MKRLVCLIVCTIGLAACAPNQSRETAAESQVKGVDAEQGKVCTYETPSRIGARAKRVCREID